MLFNKWKSSVKKLQNNEMTAQAFVNANEKKVLYYSTPFLTDEEGGTPNTLQKDHSDILYFPAFTTPSGLKAYMQAIGHGEYLFIKGDLKSVLASLDSHPALQEWGLVVDAQGTQAVEIPPQTRVQPRCLR